MKRKLFALLLSGFAIILLMGAGVENLPQAQAEEAGGSVRTVELEVPVEEPVNMIEDDTMDVQPENETGEDGDAAAKEDSEQETAPVLDATLLVNGQPVPQAASKRIVDGVTYVSLKVMSLQLDPTAQISWNEAGQTVTVTTSGLHLTAVAGQQYLEANGRYLYIPDGLQIVDGQMMVPLKVLAKAFDAIVGWEGSTGTVTVATGSGAILPGDAYYDQTDLFWLSRVIYAESGNQSLEGKMAVGNVVLNRVRNSLFPNTILGVLSQRNQFSTYRSGTLANRTPNAQSVIAAKLVLDGGVVEEVACALYFDSASSSWASRNRTCLAVIGAHKFYG